MGLYLHLLLSKGIAQAHARATSEGQPGASPTPLLTQPPANNVHTADLCVLAERSVVLQYVHGAVRCVLAEHSMVLQHVHNMNVIPEGVRFSVQALNSLANLAPYVSQHIM